MTPWRWRAGPTTTKPCCRHCARGSSPGARARTQPPCSATPRRSCHCGTPSGSRPRTTNPKRDLARALLRVGRRRDAEPHLNITKDRSQQIGLRMSVTSAMILEAAVATASGRFTDGKRLAAQAAEPAVARPRRDPVRLRRTDPRIADGAWAPRRRDRPASRARRTAVRLGVASDARRHARRLR